ncbi:MAG TPA: amino acid adenylation domain-containing protein [Egibacteraceae bacterium]|nr:amino acid adenylation domain-containing protein [Egibacteraceae bacterium]
MVPSRFVALPALPLNPNGKLDRNALCHIRPPDPIATGGPARTPTEKAVARLFGEVLGQVGAVGRDVSFFDAGGGSLDAVRLLARIRYQLSADFDFAALLAAPTVRDLSARIDEAGCRPGGRRSRTPAESTRQGCEPASGQRRLLYLERMHWPTSAYVLARAWLVEGPFSVDAMRRSLNFLVERHAALRTVFPATEEGWMATVSEGIAPGFEVADLEAIAQPRQEEYARTRLEEAALRPFDLAHGPLVRALVIRHARERHTVVVALHHAIADGWSLDVMARELSALYAADSTGTRPALTDVPPVLVDAGGQRPDDRDYWQRTLHGATPALSLRRRPRRHDAAGKSAGRHSFRVDPGVVLGLDAIGRRNGATRFMTLHAALLALLHRQTGRSDLVVGAPFANRDRPGLESAVGFLVNTLALRTAVKAEANFDDLVLAVRRTVTGALAHSALPFDEVVRLTAPERTGTRLPLFDVMITYDDKPESPLEVPGANVTAVTVPAPAPKVDLALLATRTDDELHCSFEFDVDALDEREVARMARRFEVLLGAIVDAPDTPIGRLNLLPPGERRVLIDEWGRGPVRPRGPDVLTLFHDRTRSAPEAVAVVDDRRRVTYRQLAHLASGLAERLRQLGVRRGDRVGVLAPRSAELATAFVGILEASAAYVPLDPSAPPARLAAIGRDAQLRVVVVHPQIADRLPPGQFETVVAHVDPLARDADGMASARAAPALGSVAYVCYTSGSTGKPKGVLVTHGGLANTVGWYCDELSLGPSDRVAQLAAPAFDAASADVWPCLAAGATLHVPPAEVLVRPERLRDWLMASGVTACFAVTPLAEQLLALRWPADASLRVLVTGGDALQVRPPPGLPFRLLNNYGPTEASIIATGGTVAPGESTGPGPSIGRPIANARVYILDPWGEPAPIGVPGELYIGGKGVAAGYLDRPGLTAERFLPDRFSPEPNARMYRTGDLARFRPDGEIEFLGRLDRQVKIQGCRVELGEVEAALAEHPAGFRSAVIAHRDQRGIRLVAYLAPGRGPVPEPAEVRRFLRCIVTEVMVPAEFVVLDQFPLTPNGKLDRSALPPPAPRRRPLPSPPVSAAEARLAALFSGLLGVAHIGANDDFFALGGHSLLAVELLGRIERELGMAVPLHTFLESPTAAALARLVTGDVTQPMDRRRAADREGATAPLDPAIHPGEPRIRLASRPRSILLTGATGFVGAHLLRELLTTTDVSIRCLVRAASSDHGAARIREALDVYSLWDEGFGSRVVPVPGDLGLRHLGLDSATYAELAASVDTIWHAGADVRLLVPSSQLRAVNVEGTIEVLRLAAAARAGAVHHVSTVSVFPTPTSGGPLEIHESDIPSTAQGLASGYSRTKRLAELTAAEAARRGLPVAIHRLGRVAAHSSTGACNPNDVFTRWIETCVRLRLVPQLSGRIEASPVDYVAGAMAALTLADHPAGTVFHPLSGGSLSSDALARLLMEAGHPVAVVPLDRWRTELSRLAQASPRDRASASLLANVGLEDGPRVDTTATGKALAKAGFDVRGRNVELRRLGPVLDHLARTDARRQDPLTLHQRARSTADMRS